MKIPSISRTENGSECDAMLSVFALAIELASNEPGEFERLLRVRNLPAL